MCTTGIVIILLAKRFERDNERGLTVGVTKPTEWCAVWECYMLACKEKKYMFLVGILGLKALQC